MHERGCGECSGALCIGSAWGSNGMHARLHTNSRELCGYDVRVTAVVADSGVQRNTVVQSIVEVTEKCSGGLTPRLQHQRE